MAFTFEKNKNSKIKVILAVDSAIKRKDKYEEYLESFKNDEPDESLLELEGIPSRFVLRKTLTFEAKQKLRSKNFKVRTRKNDDETGMEIDVNYTYDLLRMLLIDIENPPGIDGVIVYKNGSDNYCSSDIINILDEANCVNDLIKAHNNATTKLEKEDEVEKNF